MKITVSVIPNAKKPSVEKISKDEYKVKVDAPAVDGKANRRLIEIIADYFNTSKNSVNIIKGFKSKNKIIKIE